MADSAKPKNKYLVTWDQFHRDTRTLGKKLISLRQDWKGIVAVTTGGLIPSGILAWEFEIKLIDVIGVSSYAGFDDPNQKHVRILKNYDVDMVKDGDGWLVIDDLVDSGNTIRAVREKLPKAYYGSVYAKPNGEPLIDTFAVAVPQDHWVYFPWYLDTQPTDPQPTDPIVYAYKKR